MTPPEQQELPFVSVIIPVYNDTARLKVLLELLQKQTYPSHLFEVIVVDNASREPVAPALENAPNARIVVETNPGPDKARKAGLAHAKGDYLAFTDSDCVPYPDWLENGIRAMLRNPGCGLVGGRVDVFPKDPKQMTWVEYYESVFAFPTKDNVNRHHFMPTCNMFTRKDVFEAVGPFNDTLRSSGDQEWGERVYKHGYKLVYDDSVAIRHPARRTLKEVQKKIRRMTFSHTALLIKDASSKWFPVFLQNKFYRRLFIFPTPSEVRKTLRSQHTLTNKIKILLIVLWTRVYRAWVMLRSLFPQPERLW
ncbi:MAG: glycosyltransferase family A protein [bacterium]|nr:glycosyltransferase family A protein [bacterium]